MRKFYKPPKCPYCKQELKIVLEKEKETYIFKEATGMYQLERSYNSMSLMSICPYCSRDVSNIFKDGVCNYIDEKKI